MPRSAPAATQQRGLLVSVFVSLVLLFCIFYAKTALALETKASAEDGLRLRLQQLLREAADAGATTPNSRLISVGDHHVCQVNRGNFIQCWGTGYGVSPVTIPSSLTETTGIATAGFDSTCAWNQGAVECWGNSRVFAKWTASDLSGPIADFAFSEQTFCALSGQDQLIRCWGSTSNGELGIGIKYGSRETPTVIHSPQGVQFQQVRSKGNVFCAVSATGDVYCWGAIACWPLDKSQGLFCGLGGQSEAWATTPTKIEGIPGRAKAVEIGWLHACVLLENSDIYCFGQNGAGQLGIHKTSFNSWTPVKVQFAFPDVKLITCGSVSTYAVLGNGDVMAWGQFGGAIRYEPMSRKPVKILSSEPGSIVSISCSCSTRSSFNCCVRYASKGSQCWGETYWLMLGNGVEESVSVIVQPVDVLNG